MCSFSNTNIPERHGQINKTPKLDAEMPKYIPYIGKNDDRNLRDQKFSQFLKEPLFFWLSARILITITITIRKDEKEKKTIIKKKIK